ncbi:amidase [Emergencia timonensis]|uniref:amidase family protein n=1 Tax=Emergencia timonensis TaxID=1776384 RepID=UPI001D092B91|nr:amidase family protein [Emergencia timonensis]MBS6175444.1 amidase [Clostridiales bacterium]MCB6474722.1 amidase [Emergencia timonensis]
MKINVVKLTIRKAASLMEQHAFSSYDLTKECLNRIEAMNQKGPALQAVLEVNPGALDAARRLDQERAEGTVRSLLHGIPLLLKDNIATGDDMHTSAGSFALRESFASRDAFLVRRLREAGAVFVGKANMTEWANFISYTMPDGFSARGGRVKNYFHLDFPVGGSSSGCAVGVAAGFALAAIGTETSGSIIKPSVHSSLIGLKPSMGLVSRSGIIPISRTQDTAGPMAKTAEDAAILLDIMAGSDSEDPAAVSADVWKERRAAHPFDCQKEHCRIGVLSQFFAHLEPSHKSLITKALQRFEESGHQIIEVGNFAPYENIYDENTPDYLGEEVLLYEFREGLESYLQNWTREKTFLTLKELIQYNELHREQAIPYGQEVFYRAEAAAERGYDAIYQKARARDYRVCVTCGLEKALQENKLDLLAFPHFYGCTVPARAGWPALTLPVGMDLLQGPTALTLVGNQYDDWRLLQMASVLERLLN